MGVIISYLFDVFCSYINPKTPYQHVTQVRRAQSFPRVEPKPELQERSFGEYMCRGCGRYWSSAWSWSDCSQECKRCGTKVLPFNRRPLVKSDEEINVESSHESHLCQKCQQLGTLCVGAYYRKRQIMKSLASPGIDPGYSHSGSVQAKPFRYW